MFDVLLFVKFCVARLFPSFAYRWFQKISFEENLSQLNAVAMKFIKSY